MLGGDRLRGRHALTAWLFQRLLGLTALTAFVSLHVQLAGLFGRDGIAPLAPRIDRLIAAGETWSSRPTLLVVLGADDSTLALLCVLGELAAILLLGGILPGPAAVACWAIYLSFVDVGAPFLPLQWDTLLCEALVLAAVIAPWREVLHLPWRAREPAHLARWTIVLLVARLMLASGIVKIAADEVWRDLTALSYHYETQPLPGPLSPWMHAMPMWVHRLGALFTFFAELVIPALFLGPPRVRGIAVISTIALQVLISLTGNFGFFNLLTCVLCVMALDDGQVARVLPSRWIPTGEVPLRPWQVIAPSLAAVLLGVLQLTHFASSLGAPVREELLAIVDRTDRLRLASSYGLFADMTTERPELIVEGSLDGEHWVAYELPYKPGALDRPPPLVGPHMPRLDWMLWFAALNERPEDVPWIFALERALLERRGPVLDLFEDDPFDGAAPRFVRITRWQYFFAHPESDAVWERREPTPFGRVLERR